MDREKTRLLRMKDLVDDHGYVPGTPEERINMVWPMTVEAVSLNGKYDTNQPLQRHIVRIIRRGS